MNTTYKYHMFYILETRMQSWNDVQNFINTPKYSYVSIYDGHDVQHTNALTFLLHNNM
jgi:hypothetical protein